MFQSVTVARFPYPTKATPALPNELVQGGTDRVWITTTSSFDPSSKDSVRASGSENNSKARRRVVIFTWKTSRKTSMVHLIMHAPIPKGT